MSVIPNPDAQVWKLVYSNIEKRDKTKKTIEAKGRNKQKQNRKRIY